MSKSKRTPAITAVCLLLITLPAVGCGCGNNAAGKIASITPSAPSVAVRSPVLTTVMAAREKDAERESAARGRASKQ